MCVEIGFLLEVWFHSDDQRTSDLAGLLPPNESYLILHAAACWLLSANSVACSPWKRISCNLAMWKKCACSTNMQEQHFSIYPGRLPASACSNTTQTWLLSQNQIGAYFSGPETRAFFWCRSHCLQKHFSAIAWDCLPKDLQVPPLQGAIGEAEIL